jgi:hypothetical protein
MAIVQGKRPWSFGGYDSPVPHQPLPGRVSLPQGPDSNCMLIHPCAHACHLTKLFLKLHAPWHPPSVYGSNGVRCSGPGRCSSLSCWHLCTCLRAPCAIDQRTRCKRQLGLVCICFPNRDFLARLLGRNYLDRSQGRNPTQAPCARQAESLQLSVTCTHLPVKCGPVLHSAHFALRTSTSIDEKQTASDLLRLLCLSTLLYTLPHLCLTQTTRVAATHTPPNPLPSPASFTATATILSACIPNRQSPSPQELSLAARHLSIASQTPLSFLSRVCILPFVASLSLSLSAFLL